MQRWSDDQDAPLLILAGQPPLSSVMAIGNTTSRFRLPLVVSGSNLNRDGVFSEEAALGLSMLAVVSLSESFEEL